ncbi:MAG: hypothetical protein N2170_00615 [Bacteroidia bacterium]|nr:hypothetical protein [Bacteroidia bacterium]
MKIAIVGPPRDLHLQRWGKALETAGAQIVYVGVEPPPVELSPYECIGPPTPHPTWITFWMRRHLLKTVLEKHNVTVAHPIHLTPSALWVWASGFRPYIPFAMGADLFEYSPSPPPLKRSWTLQSRNPSLWGGATVHLRRLLYPALLQKILRDSLLAVGDNYEICFMKKFFEKEKKYIELPTGIVFPSEESFLPAGSRRLLLAPRGATLLYQADIILEAFQKYLQAGGAFFSLSLLAGPYPIHPTIKAKAAHLKKHYPDLFFFLEKKISYIEMKSLWKQAAAFISAPVYDGYSYAVAEGRLYGALPIVNSIPAHREILTHGYNAWFVEPFSSDKLAETLFSLESLFQNNTAPFWEERNRRWIHRFSDLQTNATLFLQHTEAALHHNKLYLHRQTK